MAAQVLDNVPPPKSRGLLGLCKICEPGEEEEFAVKNSQVHTPDTRCCAQLFPSLGLSAAPFAGGCPADVPTGCARWLSRLVGLA